MMQSELSEEDLTKKYLIFANNLIYKERFENARKCILACSSLCVVLFLLELFMSTDLIVVYILIILPSFVMLISLFMEYKEFTCTNYKKIKYYSAIIYEILCLGIILQSYLLRNKFSSKMRKSIKAKKMAPKTISITLQSPHYHSDPLAQKYHLVIQYQTPGAGRRIWDEFPLCENCQKPCRSH